MDKEIKTNLADWKSDLQEPDLNGWDEEDRKLALLEHQNAALKELCRVAWARLDKIDPNAEITQRLFDALD